MTQKNGWASIRAVEVTIEPGDGLDMAAAIAATLSGLGWGPGEQEFNLTTNVSVHGPADPPPVAGPTDPPPVAEKADPSRPGIVKVRDI